MYINSSMLSLMYMYHNKIEIHQCGFTVKYPLFGSLLKSFKCICIYNKTDNFDVLKFAAVAAKK